MSQLEFRYVYSKGSQLLSPRSGPHFPTHPSSREKVPRGSADFRGTFALAKRLICLKQPQQPSPSRVSLETEYYISHAPPPTPRKPEAVSKLRRGNQEFLQKGIRPYWQGKSTPPPSDWQFRSRAAGVRSKGPPWPGWLVQKSGRPRGKLTGSSSFGEVGLFLR